MQKFHFNPNSLSFEPVKSYNFRWLGLGAICLLLLGFSSAVKVNTLVERIPIYLEHQADPCNESTVKKYIKTLNLRFPKIVFQQVMVETGHLSSPIFKDLHNLTGMECTTGRPTLGANIGQRFAKYESWQASLQDYCIWQAQMTREVRNEEEYYQFLDRVYCPQDAPENKGQTYSVLLKQIKDTI